jgi:hypothetical protein
MVRVLGDLSNLNKSFTTAQSAGTKAAQGMHTAFTGMLGALNQTGVLGPFGDALAGIDTALDSVGKHAKDIGPAMIGVGGALAGVGVGLAALGSADQAAHSQLQQAIAATGKSYDDYAGKVDSAVKHQEKFGDTASQTEDALRILTQATGDPTKALNDLSIATDLAAAKHETLDTAATAVGKAYNGNTKILKEFGITTTGNTKSVAAHTQAINELAAKLHGQASAAADTFTGHLDAVKAHLEDVAASFGQKYGPAITAAGTAMAGLGATIEVTRTVLGLFTTAEEGAAAGADALAASELTADAAGIGMIATVGLVGLALVALAAAAYAIYRNWNTIWAAMKAVVVDVWDWIQKNWPLLLAIILGPIALAALEIVRHWTAITNAAAAVLDWFKTHWPLLLAILTGPVGLAVLEIVRHWNDLMSFITGLPGRIAHIAAGMWHGISDAFRDTINFLIDIWNRLHFTLPKVSVLGVHIGGETIGVPQIPHLAQGGLITQTGLIFAHAGEAITPIGKATGPAVNIEHAHFSSEVDVESFMRKAAWIVQTQKI